MVTRPILAVALLAGLAACNSQPAEEPAAEANALAEPAPAEAAAAPSPAAEAMPATATASEPPFAVKEGDSLKVAKQAECFEVADPAASPWTMFPGVTVTYKGMQDGKAKVAGIAGADCLIPWDAVTKG
jgi:hypothetical protein